MPTSVYRRHTEALATQHLGVDLMAWIARELEAGQSWRSIPDRLSDATDGDVTVTRQSLRGWWIDDARPDVTAA